MIENQLHDQLKLNETVKIINQKYLLVEGLIWGGDYSTEKINKKNWETNYFVGKIW